MVNSYNWTEVGLVFLALIVVLWPAARAVRLSQLRQQARQKMQWGANEAQLLRDQVSQFARQPVNQAELAAYGALTAAEFVWSWARVDPSVVKAAAFSSSVPIHNGYDFAQYIHSHYDILGAAAKEGFFNRLTGYIGEQHVADLLVHQGHVVEAAATATHPVWDLLVDGHPVNVKTVQEIASIKAEAMAHHGVTYLVPSDAHGSLVPNMEHVARFSHEAVHTSLREGIAASHGEHAMHGLGMHLPLVTIGFSAYRNYQAVRLGKDVSVALKHTAAESVGRGAGGVVGAKAGGVIGGYLALGNPLGIAAGALIGAVGGALFGGSVAEQYKRRPLEAAMTRMGTVLHEFGASFASRLDTVQGYLEAPLVRMESSLREVERDLLARKARLSWWLWPDFYTVLLEESALQGQREILGEQQKVVRVANIFQKARSTGRYEGIGLMMVNAPAVCELVGFDQAKISAIEAARKSVFYERKQLNPHFSPPTTAT